MNSTRFIAMAVLPSGAFAANYVISGAVSAAQPIPIPARFGRTPPPTIITHMSSPLWVFAIVAAVASALTIAASIAVTRLRHSGSSRHYLPRRQISTSSSEQNPRSASGTAADSPDKALATFADTPSCQPQQHQTDRR
jgi:hypothetical protein